eukprot:g33437.t1
MWSLSLEGRGRAALLVLTGITCGSLLLWYLFREAEEEESPVRPDGLRQFVPTEEWQEVPPGYACPPGLESGASGTFCCLSSKDLQP